MRFLIVLLLGVASSSTPSKTRRKADEQREKYASRDPEERKAHRLEKYDRLLEMAAKAKVEMPNLLADVEALKKREEAIIDRDAELRPPRPPRLGGEDGEEFGEGDSPWNSGMEEMLGGDYRKENEPKEEVMKDARERLEKMREMSPEERVDEMRKAFDSRLADKVAKAAESPPSKLKHRSTGLEHLSPEERHAKLMEHQKNMDEHRTKMDAWREQHEDYIAERRAIMDSYRDLSQQIRESVFANRPL